MEQFLSEVAVNQYQPLVTVSRKNSPSVPETITSLSRQNVSKSQNQFMDKTYTIRGEGRGLSSGLLRLSVGKKEIFVGLLVLVQLLWSDIFVK